MYSTTSRLPAALADVQTECSFAPTWPGCLRGGQRSSRWLLRKSGKQLCWSKWIRALSASEYARSALNQLGQSNDAAATGSRKQRTEAVTGFKKGDQGGATEVAPVLDIVALLPGAGLGLMA